MAPNKRRYKDPDLDRAVGQAMRAMRQAKGISQAKLAADIGTTPNTISRQEKGKVTLSVQQLGQYANYYGTEPQAFLAAPLDVERARALIGQKGEADEQAGEEEREG